MARFHSAFRSLAWAVGALVVSIPSSASPASAAMSTAPVVTVAGTTCKQVSSCEEAVELWCGGYRRADADHDGIPCENVCHSVKQVDEIRSRIGC